MKSTGIRRPEAPISRTCDVLIWGSWWMCQPVRKVGRSDAQWNQFGTKSLIA